MGILQTSTPFSFEDYLDYEKEQPEKHEYVRGEIFARVGARRVHVTVSGNLCAAFKAHLRGTPWWILNHGGWNAFAAIPRITGYFTILKAKWNANLPVLGSQCRLRRCLKMWMLIICLQRQNKPIPKADDTAVRQHSIG